MHVKIQFKYAFLFFKKNVVYVIQYHIRHSYLNIKIHKPHFMTLLNVHLMIFFIFIVNLHFGGNPNYSEIKGC